jgi:4-amino-4-deoxy-L-arabinose transferase-like glycosyltransferase
VNDNRLQAKSLQSLLRRLRTSCAVSIGVGLVYAVFFWRSTPVGTAFQFGENEGYELMKAYLCSLGYSLYGNFWNDQPPLHTGLLYLLFKVFGPSLLAARLLALAFAGLLVGGLYEVTRRDAGHLGALTALLILAAWTSFMRTSVSVMLDPAAMALAILSVLLLKLAIDPKDRTAIQTIVLVGASGFIMGLGLQTKLTVAIFFPAILIELFLHIFRNRGENNSRLLQRDLKAPWILCLVWGSMLLGAVFLVWLAFPSESLHDLLYAHFSAEMRSSFARNYGFDVRFLTRDLIFIVPAIAGVLWIVIRRESRYIFPVILFAAVWLVHLNQRPFWSYYTLHFAIPAAWLAGILIGDLWRWIQAPIVPDLSRRPALQFLGVTTWSLAVASITMELPNRLGSNWESVSRAQLVEENIVVKELNRYSRTAQWIFSDMAIVAFHAKLPIPPEIAVIPEKRFWSGQISPPQIKTIIEQYRPAIICVTVPFLRKELSELLCREYRETGGAGLFVRKDF